MARPEQRPLAPLPVRAPLTDEVYESLKVWIIDQIREAGVRVNIEAVARSLDVSPTPVREALVRLEAEGFVVKEPQRGYSVTPPLTPARLRDLYDLRLLLEPWAAHRAAAQRRPDDVERLRDELASCPQAPAGDGYTTYQALVAHDARFHDLVLAVAGNDEVRAAFVRTNCHLHLFRLNYGRHMGTPALDEHHAIVTAIVDGNPDAAEAAMRAHLERARDRIEDAIA